MFSSLLINHNLETTTLDAVTERENLNYILNLGLLTSVVQQIDLRLIFHNVYIDNLIIALNIELNL